MNVYCPETLKFEKAFKFTDKDIDDDSRLKELNKNYPIVSDGKRLFAIFTKFSKS